MQARGRLWPIRAFNNITAKLDKLTNPFYNNGNPLLAVGVRMTLLAWELWFSPPQQAMAYSYNIKWSKHQLVIEVVYLLDMYHLWRTGSRGSCWWDHLGRRCPRQAVSFYTSTRLFDPLSSRIAKIIGLTPVCYRSASEDSGSLDIDMSILAFCYPECCFLRRVFVKFISQFWFDFFCHERIWNRTKQL